jgi:hypothetical protein
LLSFFSFAFASLDDVGGGFVVLAFFDIEGDGVDADVDAEADAAGVGVEGDPVATPGLNARRLDVEPDEDDDACCCCDCVDPCEGRLCLEPPTDEGPAAATPTDGGSLPARTGTPDCAGDVDDIDVGVCVRGGSEPCLADDTGPGILDGPARDAAVDRTLPPPRSAVAGWVLGLELVGVALRTCV